MDYKKKSLNKTNQKESYEEIDTRLASGWYVDAIDNRKKKKYKTDKVTFKISKNKNIKENNVPNANKKLLTKLNYCSKSV